MKLKDIKQLLKDGYRITYTQWNGRHYDINYNNITSKQIIKLKEELGLKEYYNKSAPLTGVLK